MGARLVKDINRAGSSSPNELTSVNGLLFFSAELERTPAASETSEEKNNTSTDNEETATAATKSQVGLMRSDGTDDGTTILKSFDSVNNLVHSGGQLYFVAGINDQYQLWTSDGTTRGTVQVKDLYPNADPNFPQDLFEIDGVLFYSAIDGSDSAEGGVDGGIGKYPYTNGYEVWRKEGNGIGSVFFRNLIPDKIITDIDYIEELDSSLILDKNGQPIQLTTTTTIEKVIKSDGTTLTTTTIEQEAYSNGEIITLVATTSTQKETTAADVASIEIQKTTSPASTPISADITTSVFENDSFPGNFVGINGNYFFTAQSSSFYSLETKLSNTLIGGLELYFSDGTESGTYPININQNSYTFYEPDNAKYTPATIIAEDDFGFFERSSSSFPRELTPAKDKLYFVANDGITGFELWSITDQGENPQIVSDLHEGNTSSSPQDLTIVGNNLYFSADSGSGRKLFYFNDSLNAPEIVKNSGDNPKALTEINNTLYFSAVSELGRELYSAKGKNSELISDINPGPESSSPDNITLVNRKDSRGKNTDYLYFTANDGSHGIEVMSMKIKGGKRLSIKSDSDIITGPPSSFPDELINHNQQLFFTAKDSSRGREPWTVGPAIKGPTGESGASSSNINIFENKTFVYKFKTDDKYPKNTTWKINSGNDASFFKINPHNGKLKFKSKQAYKNPMDHNEDNIYEVFVRSSDNDSGYKSDLLSN
jgi:ELWxxDGT repeat protein